MTDTTSLFAGTLTVIILALPSPGATARLGQPGEPPGAPPRPTASAPAPPNAARVTWPAMMGGVGVGAGGGVGGWGGGGVSGGALDVVKLDGWTLTIPAAGRNGDAASVSPANGVPPWLVRGPDGSLTFWAPVRGATTAHSNHARTELVSVRNFTAGRSGPHTLRASLSVVQLPTQTPDIIVGQIHGAEQIRSVPFVMLHYAAGAIHVVVKRGGDSASDKYPLISGVPLGARFDYTITDSGDGNLTFSAACGSNTRTATARIPEPFLGATVRFQAGDYQQGEASAAASAGDGARVTFYRLDERDRPGSTAP